MAEKQSEPRFVLGADVSSGTSWGARSARRRVLVEAPEAQWDFVTRWARRHTPEWEVIVCGGPEEMHDCPVLGGEACPLAEGADAVVAGLGLHPPTSESLCGLRSRVMLTHRSSP